MGLFELKILDFIQKMRFPALDFIMAKITALGEWGVFFIIVTALLLLFRKTRSAGIACAASLVLSFLLVDLTIKPLAARPRPYVLNGAATLLISPPSGFSFPSGHSSVSFAFAEALRPLGRNFLICAYVLASLIAFSRLYLYVHYPSDVLAGALVGVLCGIAPRALRRKCSKKSE